MRIYLAAPLFTMAERRWNEELAGQLEEQKDGLEVVLPQKEDTKVSDGSIDFGELFNRNVEAIESADIVLAILDGADVDSGTAWECGYAHARDKPVIGIRTDFRSSEDEKLNAMLNQSVRLIYSESTQSNLEQIADQVIGVLYT